MARFTTTLEAVRKSGSLRILKLEELDSTRKHAPAILSTRKVTVSSSTLSMEILPSFHSLSSPSTRIVVPGVIGISHLAPSNDTAAEPPRNTNIIETRSRIVHATTLDSTTSPCIVDHPTYPVPKSENAETDVRVKP